MSTISASPLDSTVPQERNVHRTMADPPIGGYLIDGDGDANLKSDTADLPHPIRGFEVCTTAGHVKVTCSDGSVLTLLSRQLYSRTSLCIVRVWSTGTTAVGIIGLR